MKFIKRLLSTVHKFTKMNLNKQMLLGFALVMLVTLSLAYQINYRYMSEILIEKHQQTTLSRMEQISVKFDLFANNVDSVLNYIGFNSDVKKLSKTVFPLPVMQYDEYLLFSSILSNISLLCMNNEDLYSIYLYTDNQYLVGWNPYSRIARRQKSNIPITNTDFFSTVTGQSFKTFWTNGISEITFSNVENINLMQVENNITAGKSFKDMSDKSNITILINIWESSVYQLYQTLFDNETDTVFIVNSNNIVLSSNNKEAIGQPCSYDIIGLGSNSGEFSSNQTGSTMQVVYHKADNPNWYIVMETPDEVYRNEIFNLQRFSILIFIACFVITVFFVMLWTKTTTKPLSILCDKMDEVGKGKFGVQIDIHPRNELGSAIGNFNIMSNNLARLNKENQQIERQRREQELRALRAQINPHFIYNTLNMIKWMAIMQKADNIVDSIVTLADILKPVFKTSNEMVTLAEEIEYLENYIKILNYRLENNIILTMDDHGAYSDVVIPRFTLQPLIENCVQHGYTPNQQILIRVRIMEDNGDLIITISDDGRGISPQKLKEITDSLKNASNHEEYEAEEKVGIYNVNKRIILHYGDKYGLSIVGTGKQGTTVSLRIPRKNGNGSQRKKTDS